MKILLVNGSPAEKSHTFSLLDHLKNLLQQRDVRVEFWDLRAKPLPFALPQYHHQPSLHPDKNVRDFVQAVKEADAIVLGTPFYHGSYSGVLKNALDNMNKDVLRNKPVGLVVNGGRRSTNPLDHLRSVIRALYGYTLQTQIATQEDDYQETSSEYEVVNVEIQQRCERFIEELLFLARVLK
jgi:NAD(P)H-dependent FMN reductase